MGVKDGVILMGLLTIKINIKKHPLRSEGHALLRAISNTFSTSPDQQQNNFNLLFVEPYFSEIKGGLLRPFHVVFFFWPPPETSFFVPVTWLFWPDWEIDSAHPSGLKRDPRKPSSQRSLACWFYFFVSPYELRDEQTPWFKRQILKKQHGK